MNFAKWMEGCLIVLLFMLWDALLRAWLKGKNGGILRLAWVCALFACFTTFLVLIAAAFLTTVIH